MRTESYSPSKKESKQPNYLRRRLAAGLLAATTLVGGVVAVKKGFEYVESVNVNVHVPEEVLEELRQSDNLSKKDLEKLGVMQVTVEKGDTIDGIAKVYIEDNDLNVDVPDVRSALMAQNDNVDEIYPGDKFYLPVQD